MERKKRLVVIDGQGGGIGKTLVAELKKSCAETFITAVGTNSAATTAMLKAGADQAATGENAVIVAARSAEVIIGPVGIVIADAMLGEITPAMAVAIGQSPAQKILVPLNLCHTLVVGVTDFSYGRLIQAVVEKVNAYGADGEEKAASEEKRL